jgi:UDP-N-acetylglucosamine--N-acetylmuramyl-(pentapeptide) pyrophosphoryl-undecaprenol N-acetylglucosamine transferase
VCGVVPVVVPLPAADDHQQRNAEALVRENAAFMLLQNDFDATAFKNLIKNLIENKKTLNEMSMNLNKVVQRGAALRIAEDIFQSVNKK